MSTLALPDTKVCRNCGLEKMLFRFSLQKGGRYGRRAQCKECHAARSKLWREKNPQKAQAATESWNTRPQQQKRDYRLRRLYGISEEQYLEMVSRQNERCAICNKKKHLHVDHCHTTGRIRGVLCGNCNRALGMMADRPDRLRSAAAYLESSR